MTAARNRPRYATLLWLLLLVALAPAPALAARRQGNACLSTDQGPCASPDAVSFLPGAAPVTLTNFGLLYPAAQGKGWEVVCDDNFGLAPATRVRQAPDGRMFAASNEGLFWSSDGCQFQMAGGAIAAKLVYDVTFDSRNPARVWALGDLPRKLWVSADGGRMFTQQQAFPDEFTVSRVAAAPSDPQRVYLFGRGLQGTTPLGVSSDGGVTFVTSDLTAAASPAPPSAFDFLAISPSDPLTVYFVALASQGDQLWKTTDGGKTIRRVLSLEGMQALGGFTFGATAATLFVGATSTDIAIAPGTPPANLYISRDGGATWQPPVPSGQAGPRYTCLAASGDVLYACGAGELLGDTFMVGVSRDLGRTWTPTVQLADLGGARSCVKSQCLRTEVWLCESYNQCAAGVTPRLDAAPPFDPDAPEDAGTNPASDGPKGGNGGSSDAGARDATPVAPAPARKSSGCSLTSPGPAGDDGGWAGWPGLLLGLAVTMQVMDRRRRQRRRRRSAVGQA